MKNLYSKWKNVRVDKISLSLFPNSLQTGLIIEKQFAVYLLESEVFHPFGDLEGPQEQTSGTEARFGSS